MDIDSWSIGRLLNTAARLNERSENERLKAHGITLSGVTLLRALPVRTAVSQARLADLLHIKPQTAGKTAERLELRGFLRRVRDQDDRRLVLVTLTAPGRRLLLTLEAEQEEFDRTTGLADQDFRAALENIIVSLRPAGSDAERQMDSEGAEHDRLLALVR